MYQCVVCSGHSRVIRLVRCFFCYVFFVFLYHDSTVYLGLPFSIRRQSKVCISICMFCKRISQFNCLFAMAMMVLVRDKRSCAECQDCVLKSECRFLFAMEKMVLVRVNGSCVYAHGVYTYISTQFLVCDGHDGPGPG